MPFLELAVTSGPVPAPLIESPPPPPGARVPVSQAELERAISVWLKTMPSHLWKPYIAMLAIDRKLLREDDHADPREILASYLAAKFHQVHWEASYEQPGRPAGGSDARAMTDVDIPLDRLGNVQSDACARGLVEHIRRSAIGHVDGSQFLIRFDDAADAEAFSVRRISVAKLS